MPATVFPTDELDQAKADSWQQQTDERLARFEAQYTQPPAAAMPVAPEQPKPVTFPREAFMPWLDQAASGVGAAASTAGQQASTAASSVFGDLAAWTPWATVEPAAAAPALGMAASGVPSAMPTGPAPSLSTAGAPDGSPPTLAGGDRPSRIASALPMARAAEARTGVPAEVNLAFAVHESGLEDRYGPGNSFHGRHATDGEDGTPITDWGYDAQGNRVDYPTKLKSYQDAAGSFNDFADLISSSPRYQPALQRYQQTGDKAQLVRDIWTAGYGESKTGPAETVDIMQGQVAPVAGRAPGPQPTTPDRANAAPSGGGALDVNDVARRYAGGTYTFGGGRDAQGGIPGAKNTDCSGFVSAVMREQGVALPAQTDAAYTTLRHLGAQQVTPDQARPGDIVFYMGSGFGGEITYHMGLYAGPGQILDASRWQGDTGVKLRPITHAGGPDDIVILRDPRVNGPADPRAVAPPPPIQPSGIAETPAGDRMGAQNAADATPSASAAPGAGADSPPAVDPGAAPWSPDQPASQPGAYSAPTGRAGGGGVQMQVSQPQDDPGQSGGVDWQQKRPPPDRTNEPLGPTMTGAPWENRYGDQAGSVIGTNRNQPRLSDPPVETHEPPLPTRNMPVQGGPIDEGTSDETGTYTQLYRQPQPGTSKPIQNPDGSVTTERSITVTEPGLNGGRATNIPTVWDGKIVSDAEAVQNAIDSGIAFPSFESVNAAVRAAEQRSRDLGAGRETSVGGATVPAEVQHAVPNRNRPVRGEPIDEQGGTMYRQPLSATSGPDTTPDDADPRARARMQSGVYASTSSYNDPTDGGTQSQPLPSQGGYQDAGPATDGTPIRMASGPPTADETAQMSGGTQVQPSSPETPSETYLDLSVPAPPGWAALVNGAGAVVDWVRHKAQEAVQGVQDAANQAASEYAGPVQSTPGEPDYLPSHDPGQRMATTIANEGIVRPVVRPISNAIRAAQGREPLTADTEPVPSIDRAISTTARSLESNADAVQQGYEAGDKGQMALGALGVAGDLAPSMLLARQLNELSGRVDTPIGGVGAGDVVMGVALGHDAIAAARLGYGSLKAGGQVGAKILEAIRAGIPAERFSEWLSGGLNTAANVVDRGIEAARGVGARVAEGLATGDTWGAFTERMRAKYGEDGWFRRMTPEEHTRLVALEGQQSLLPEERAVQDWPAEMASRYGPDWSQPGAVPQAELDRYDRLHADMARAQAAGIPSQDGAIPRIGPGLRATASNAAQGAVVGDAGASEQERESGQPYDLGRHLTYGAGGAALAAAAGNRTVRRAVGELGSGFVPNGRPTVETARDAVQAARQAVQDARRAVQSATSREARGAADEALIAAQRAETEASATFQEAQQARRALEPRIRSDVGRPLQTVEPTAADAEMLADAKYPRDRVQPGMQRSIGPVDDAPRTYSLGSGFVPADEGHYDPRLSPEPVLPGLEPPPRPADTLPNVSDAPNGPAQLGNVPPSQVRQPGLPGTEAPPPAPISEAVAALPTPVQNYLGAHKAQPGLSPLAWIGQAIKQGSYSSLIGPTAGVAKTGGDLSMAALAHPKEITRAIARGAPAEYGQWAAGGLDALQYDVGPAVLDAIKGHGQYSHTGGPSLSSQTQNPVGKAFATLLEGGGRLFMGVPTAIFGEAARGAGERLKAAQIATDAVRSGEIPKSAWQATIDALVEDARGVRAGDLPSLAQTQAVVDAGAAYAKRQTFQNEVGPVGQAVKRAAGLQIWGPQHNQPIPGVTNYLRPIFNTPWNMHARLAEASPAGLLKEGANLVSGKGTSFDKMYDAVTGTAVMAGLGYLATQGLQTGSGPSDPKQRADMVKDGWQPYSGLVDGVYVPNKLLYGMFAPAADMAGDVHDAIAYRKPGTAIVSPEVGLNLLARTGSLVRQEAFLQPLADTLNAIGTGGTQSLGAGAASAVASNIDRFVPYGGTARVIGASQDPYARQAQGGKTVDFGEQVRQRALAGVGARSAEPPALDQRGEPLPNPQQGARALASRAGSPRAPDPLLGYLEGQGVTLGPSREAFTVTGAGAPAPQGAPGSHEEPLSPAEQQAWLRYRWQRLQEAQPVVLADPRYRALPDENKKAAWENSIIPGAAQYADAMVRHDQQQRRVAGAGGTR